jgi:peptidoglycan/xylan/chitin deacetylase (PgdA/CDA1 family)
VSISGLSRLFKKRLLQVVSGGSFVYRFPRGRELYLTFDDGPDADHTLALLAILARYHAPATFFLVGRCVERHPDIVARVHAAGHAVGLHTHTHKTLDRMERAEFVAEIGQNQRAIHAAIGIAPQLLRPPEGLLSLRSLQWARSQGLRVIHFTYTSNDWKAESAEYIRDQIPVRSLTGGEILSFHDSNPYTLEAIPTLIDACSRRGFTFQPIR